MFQPLVSFDVTSSAAFDLEVENDFAKVTVTVKALTEAGKSFLSEMFGAGAESVELVKSKSSDFVTFANRKGLKVA